MERNKAAERERLEQERQKCNAEQAVSMHFEESLRRAKEKVSLSFITCFVLLLPLSVYPSFGLLSVRLIQSDALVMK